MAKEITLKEGEVLLHEGTSSTNMYYLVEGTLLVTKTRNNSIVQLGNICSGELVGEISFLDEKPRSASVSAQSFCRLIEIPKENFQKILETQPKWINALIYTLAKRLRKADALIKI